MDLTREIASAHRLAARIALGGGQRVGGVWDADVSGNCLTPRRTYKATPARLGTGDRPVQVSLLVPCRRCENCRQFYQMHWRERIHNEMMRANYTYFLTLTFSPIHLAGVYAEAIARGKYEGRRAVEAASWMHVRQYFARLRKGRSVEQTQRHASGSLGRKRQVFEPIRFRYFCVAEYGEEKGRLHYHGAIHMERWLPPEIFTTEWRSRAQAEIVRSANGCSTYLSKYLTKDPQLARTRCSIGYGKEKQADNSGSTPF